MSDQPFDQRFAWGTELSMTFPPTVGGTPQLVGVLEHEPVIILFKNQSTVPVFISDYPGTERGSTMIAGESFVLDCRGNKGKAVNGGFPVGTAFYATAKGGTGFVKISVVYAH